MYEIYKEARNAAWQALRDCGINTLPVNLNTVAEHYGYDVMLYSLCPTGADTKAAMRRHVMVLSPCSMATP